MKTRDRLKLVLIALVVCVAAVSCKNTTPIKTLLDDPSRFDHQKVTIAGTVKEAIGVMGYGGYRVDDGTGTILVVTQTGGAPRTGAKVGVEGEFRSAFTVGSESAAVLMESRRYTP